jgi:hypothetical protein
MDDLTGFQLGGIADTFARMYQTSPLNEPSPFGSEFTNTLQQQRAMVTYAASHRLAP